MELTEGLDSGSNAPNGWAAADSKNNVEFWIASKQLVVYKVEAEIGK